MKSFDMSLACLEIDSVALGYKALAAATSGENVRVIEASAVGNHFVILLSGSEREIREAVQRARHSVDGPTQNHWIDHEVFETFDESLLNSLYALTEMQMDESLVVVDCETVSGFLSLVHSLGQGHGLKPVEFKIRRGARGAFGYLTGMAASCAPAAEEARTKLRAALRNGTIEVIDRPSDLFRSFFNFSGQA